MGGVAAKMFELANPPVTSWTDDWDDIVHSETTQKEMIEAFFTGAGGVYGKSKDLERAIEYVHELIRDQIKGGIPAYRIFVGGHSQGGFTAIRAATSFPDAPLAGFIHLSSFIANEWELEVVEAQKHMKVLKFHGTQDEIIPYEICQKDLTMMQGTYPALEFVSLEGFDHAFRIFKEFKEPTSEVSSNILKFLGFEVPTKPIGPIIPFCNGI